MHISQFGNNAPMIVVENPPSGMGLSRGRRSKQIVEESRQQFVDNALAKGIPRRSRHNASEKLIGATWELAYKYAKKIWIY